MRHNPAGGITSAMPRAALLTLMPDGQPLRKSRAAWSAWEEKQRAIEEMLAIPTVLRECDGFRKHPAA